MPGDNRVAAALNASLFRTSFEIFTISILSTLITAGFLEEALLTPPEILTASRGFNRRATLMRSPEGS